MDDDPNPQNPFDPFPFPPRTRLGGYDFIRRRREPLSIVALVIAAPLLVVLVLFLVRLIFQP